MARGVLRATKGTEVLNQIATSGGRDAEASSFAKGTDMWRHKSSPAGGRNGKAGIQGESANDTWN